MKIKRLVIMMFCILFFTNSVYFVSSAETADSFEIKWDILLDIGGSDYSQEIIETDEGDIFLVGYSEKDDLFDSWIIKLDNEGSEKWRKTLGNSKWDHVRAIERIDDGFILVGDTYVSDDFSERRDIWVLKLDDNGEEIWSNIIENQDYTDVCSFIKKNGNEGYIIGGSSAFDETSNGFEASKALLAKIDLDGNLIWLKNFGGIKSDTFSPFQNCIVLSDKSIIAAGYTSDVFSSGKNDVWILKTDQNGKEIWNYTYGDKYSDYAYDAILFRDITRTKTDGDILLIGYNETEHLNPYSQQIIVYKLNTNGVVEWQNSYGGSKSEKGYSIIQNSDGNLFVLGTTTSYEPFVNDILYVLEIDLDGNKIRDIPISKENNVGVYEASNIIQTNDGGYIVLGNILDAGGRNVWVAKLAQSDSSQSSSAKSDNTPGFTIILTMIAIILIILLRKKTS